MARVQEDVGVMFSVELMTFTDGSPSWDVGSLLGMIESLVSPRTENTPMIAGLGKVSLGELGPMERVLCLACRKT